MFFCGFLRAPNGAAFFDNFVLYTKSCSSSSFFVILKKIAKKHDLVHEENQKKARFGARRKVKKSTVWCTKKIQKKTRFGARRKPEKNTTWCTKKNRKKHDMVPYFVPLLQRLGKTQYLNFEFEFLNSLNY